MRESLRLFVALLTPGVSYAMRGPDFVIPHPPIATPRSSSIPQSSPVPQSTPGLGDESIGLYTSPVGDATVGRKISQTYPETFFDTGSFVSWFTSYSNSGTALKKNHTINYADGSWVQGESYEDDVGVDGFIAIDLQFLSVSPNSKSFQVEAGQDSQDGALSGLIGMSYVPKSSSASSGVAGFFEHLIEQKAVTAPEFSVLFARNPTQEGHLVLGGREPAKFKGDFVTAPVVKSGSWQIKIDGYSVNGRRLDAGGTPDIAAYVDTGTNVMTATRAAADAIFAAIPGSKPGGPRFQDGTYTYPCDTPVQCMPTFIISGKPLTVDPEDFDYGPIDNTTCLANLFGNNDQWILGAPFMTSFYTVFSWGKPTKGDEVGAGTSVSFATGIQDYS